MKFFVRVKAEIFITTVLFCSLTASGQSFTTLYNFGAQAGDGTFPLPSLAFDSAGNLYGAATLSGSAGKGTIYQLSPPQIKGGFWVETIIHDFRRKPDGSVPESRLVVTAKGTPVGTTYTGGAFDMGSVFVATRPRSPGNPWTERVIYSFGSVSGDGINPNAGLLSGPSGFYGVTSGGGANNRGTVFQLTPPSVPGGPWTETILYSFKGGADAAFPSSALIRDNSGNLYGTTTLGGTSNVGAVYQLSPGPGGTWAETVIHSFTGPDGSLPNGRLQLGPNRVLYGTTDGGGAGDAGTVFQLTPSSGGIWTESVLYSFSGGSPDGGNPMGGVTLGKLGKLYGTAAHGGANGAGVVFELDPPTGGGNWTQTVLHAFTSADGFAPESELTLRNGRAFGTTTQGGLFGTGTAFTVTLP